MLRTPGWAAPAIAVALTVTLGTAAFSAARGLPHPLGARRPAPAASASAPPLSGTPAAALGDLDRVPRPASPAGSPAPAGVRPLADLRVPDLLVTSTAPLAPARLAELARVEGVVALAVFDLGPARVGGQALQVAGVDPSTFRAFTPRATATSDPLWSVVARGELAPSYGASRTAPLPLGRSVQLVGSAEVGARVGAVAAYGLPGVDIVTSRPLARRLGAVPAGAVLVSAPSRGLAALRQAVTDTLGPTTVTVLREPEVAVVKGRPKTYRDLYIASARYCPGLRWQVLAAIGQVESDHGRNNGPSSAGALGPMQFLPSTWATDGIDGDGDGRADISSPYDAVPSAARYLCRYGAGRGGRELYDAVYAYNHLDSYVRTVLELADRYH